MSKNYSDYVKPGTLHKMFYLAHPSIRSPEKVFRRREAKTWKVTGRTFGLWTNLICYCTTLAARRRPVACRYAPLCSSGSNRSIQADLVSCSHCRSVFFLLVFFCVFFFLFFQSCLSPSYLPPLYPYRKLIGCGNH